ncbi:hypothetical protein Tco_0683605 [Tanacetum coccineum]
MLHWWSVKGVESLGVGSGVLDFGCVDRGVGLVRGSLASSWISLLILKRKNVLKAQIAAEYAVADYFKFELSNISKKGPFGEIVLKTPTGSIFGSNAIARYVANGSSLLRSTNKFEFGQIEQWIGFSSVELDPNLRGWALLRLGYFNYSKDVSYFIHVLDFAL